MSFFLSSFFFFPGVCACFSVCLFCLCACWCAACVRYCWFHPLWSHILLQQKEHKMSAAAPRAHILAYLGCQVSPTMLMRSKFKSSRLPRKRQKRTHARTHAGKSFATEKTAKTETCCYHPNTITLPSLHSSLPPSASHYLLLLSLLSSRSSTSLVLSNFPCPRCFLFLFFPPPPPSSLSFRVLILSFTSTPLSPPNLHHSPSHHSLPRTLSVRSLSSWVACLCAFVLRTLLSHRSFFTLTLPSASMTHLSFIRYPSSPSPPLSLYPWTSCQCVWPFSDVYPFARFLQKAAVWPLAEFWKRNQKTLQVLYLDIRSYTYVRVLLPYVA